MTTIRLNIHEAKTHLSHYLEEVEHGKTIVLYRCNQPVAEIRALAPLLHKKRLIGMAKGEFAVPESFFEKLPEDTAALLSCPLIPT